MEWQTWADEEEAVLARVHAALAEATSPTREGMRSAAELLRLRDEAQAASDDDLPSVLHEMSVRHTLRSRAPDERRPDPARPYFAHLVVEDDRGVRDYLLGYATFVAPRHDVRVVDFRTAPIARVFYKHREGEEYEEEIAGRLVSGRVLVRRIVVIDDGRLTRILAGGRSIERGDDGRFDAKETPSFSSGASSSLGLGLFAHAAKKVDVTALLDPEQHAAITVPVDQALLVVGSAGSGKTTVALHRLAHLVSSAPERFPIERTRVIVPEEGLARLSRRLLEPLGAGAANVQTLDAWALALARQVFGDLPKIADATPAAVVALKRSAAFFDAIARLDIDGTLPLVKIRRLMLDLLTNRGFLSRVVAASNGELLGIETVVEHSVAQLRMTLDRELAHIDADAKKTIDGRDIADSTPDALAGTIDLEDLPIYLFFRARDAGLNAPTIAHLVLDEAEDFSLFELTVLGALLDRRRSVTLAGDDAQQTRTGFVSWDRALAALEVHGATRTTLAISYRCPRPVVELAKAVLAIGDDTDLRAARDGAPVGMMTLPTEGHVHLFLVDALGDVLEREPHAAIAVVASDESSARRLFGVLGELPSGGEIRIVAGGEFAFIPGLDITHVDSVKGLEFDYVVVPDASASVYPATSEARRALHVAITRTTHQLFVMSAGKRSPLLPA